MKINKIYLEASFISFLIHALIILYLLGFFYIESKQRSMLSKPVQVNLLFQNNITEKEPAKLIWEKRKEQLIEANEMEFKQDKPFVFFDRGVHDVIAYMNFSRQPYDPNEFKPENNAYQLVILLPPWEDIYVNDRDRSESFEEACGLYQHIKKIYKAYNIPIEEISLVAAKDRIISILELLKDGK